jgi:hypothetical protein
VLRNFPQAIACALAGTVVSAKKRTVRRGLLDRAGVDTSKLTSIDRLDAAFRAFEAHHLALGRFRTYGDASTGVIVGGRAPPRLNSHASAQSLHIHGDFRLDDAACESDIPAVRLSAGHDFG